MSHRYLILGLLAERPMTGYDIKKYVQVMLSAVTNASYGTLYPTLHKMLKEGAVGVREVEQRGRPSKKIYQITPAGLKTLHAWLKEPAADDQVKREFLLKLYLAKGSSPEQVRSLLVSRRELIETRLKSLKDKKRRTESTRQNWLIDYSLSICSAELDWLKKIEAKLGVV